MEVIRSSLVGVSLMIVLKEFALQPRLHPPGITFYLLCESFFSPSVAFRLHVAACITPQIQVHGSDVQETKAGELFDTMWPES